MGFKVLGGLIAGFERFIFTYPKALRPYLWVMGLKDLTK